MTDRYRTKPITVTATLLDGPTSLGGKSGGAGDYLVSYRGVLSIVGAAEFKETYSKLAPPKAKSVEVDVDAE